MAPYTTVSIFLLLGLASPAVVSPLSELEFLNSLWGLGTEQEQGYRTGLPGYIGWRNSFLGIDSWAP
jgi:hypothetical protein